MAVDGFILLRDSFLHRAERKVAAGLPPANQCIAQLMLEHLPLDRGDERLPVIAILRGFLPGNEGPCHALVVQSRDPLLQGLLPLHLQRVAHPSALIFTSLQFIGHCAISYRELIHLVYQLALLLLELHNHLLLPEILPRSEGGVLVVPVHAVDSGLEELSGSAVSVREQLDGAVHPLGLFEF